MKAAPIDRLNHAFEAIAEIEMLLNQHSYEQIKKSSLMRAALERFLEIISEASRHFPDPWKAAEPTIPWREIAALGNVIRHAYDGIDFERLWLVANDDLPILKLALLRLQSQSPE